MVSISVGRKDQENRSFFVESSRLCVFLEATRRRGLDGLEIVVAIVVVVLLLLLLLFFLTALAIVVDQFPHGIFFEELFVDLAIPPIVDFLRGEKVS